MTPNVGFLTPNLCVGWLPGPLETFLVVFVKKDPNPTRPNLKKAHFGQNKLNKTPVDP